MTQQAAALLAQGDVDHAASVSRQAVEACPANCQARRHFAEALWRQGDRVAALEQLEAAHRADPADVELSVRMGEMFIAAGQFAAALHRADEALDLDPRSAAAWALRGRALQAQGKLEEALDDYLRALGYRPDDRDVMRHLAELHVQMGRPDRALPIVEALADQYAESGEEAPQALADLRTQVRQRLGRGDEADRSIAVGRGQGSLHPWSRR